jgi:predicted  nucleic acid-binding Zn-ribbon protein
LKVVETELEDVTIDLRRSEVDVEAVVDRMKKDEARLNSGAASPKELEQTQHEFGYLGEAQSLSFEDSELEIMMRFDSVKKRLDELASDEVGLKQLELELNVRFENCKE